MGTNVGPAFVGWKFTGGDTVTYEITPIVGALFGTARGVVPGVEASLAWGPFIQVTVQRLTFSLYAFDPDLSARYVIASLTVRF